MQQGNQHPPLIHQTTEAQPWDRFCDLAGTHIVNLRDRHRSQLSQGT